MDWILVGAIILLGCLVVAVYELIMPTERRKRVFPVRGSVVKQAGHPFLQLPSQDQLIRIQVKGLFLERDKVRAEIVEDQIRHPYSLFPGRRRFKIVTQAIHQILES